MPEKGGSVVASRSFASALSDLSASSDLAFLFLSAARVRASVSRLVRGTHGHSSAARRFASALSDLSAPSALAFLFLSAARVRASVSRLVRGTHGHSSAARRFASLEPLNP